MSTLQLLKKIPVSFVNLNCVCVTLDIKRTLGQQPLNLMGYYTFVRKVANTSFAL